MATFAYNNIKNASTDLISFELNYSYHPQILFKKDVNPYLRFYSTNKLADKLK